MSGVLCAFILAACQSSAPEAPTGAQEYAANFSITTGESRYPQAAKWRVGTDTGSAILKGSGPEFSATITLATVPAGTDTVWLELWRAGVRYARIPYLFRSGVLVAQTAILDDLAVQILTKVYPKSTALAFDSVFAQMLVDGDSAVKELGFPGHHPLGVDTSAVLSVALKLALAKQLPLSVLAANWALGIDTLRVHYLVQAMAKANPGLDTSKIFPPYPVRVKMPISLDSVLTAGGAKSSVRGVFVATQGITRNSIKIYRDSVDVTNESFDITPLSILDAIDTLDLSGKILVGARANTTDGTYRLVVIVKDDSGRVAQSSALFRVVQTGVASQRILEPVNGSVMPYDSASVLFRWEVLDPRGAITKVVVAGIDASRESENVWKVRVSLPASGILQNIALIAVNSKGDSIRASLQIGRESEARDRTPPQLLRAPETKDGGIEPDSTKVTVSWRVTDASPVVVKIQDQVVAPVDGWYTARVDLVGTETVIRVLATDSAGNPSRDSVTVTKSLDRIGPRLVRLTGTSDLSVPYKTDSVRLGWKVSDNVSVKGVLLGGQPVAVAADSTCSRTVWLKLGRNVVYILATDKSNNSSQDSVVVERGKHDSIPPVIVAADTATRNKIVPFGTSQIVLSWKITDNDSVSRVLIADSVVVGKSGIFSKTISLASGTRKVYVFAADTAGNSAKDSVEIVVAPEPSKLAWVGVKDVRGVEDSTFDLLAGVSGVKGASVRFHLVSGAKTVLTDSVFTLGATSANLEVPLRLKPLKDANGKVSISLAAVCGAESTTVQFVFEVVSRNDAPSFKIAKPAVVLNGTTPQAFVGWATNMIAGPADESAQKLRFQVQALDATDLLVALPSVDSAGGLRVQAKPGVSGSARFGVRLLDDGDSLVGNQNASGWMTFDVAVNAAPTLTLPVRTFAMWQNGVQSPGSVVLADDETSASNLVLTKSSGNGQILPADSIYLSGTGASRKVTFHPVRDQTGIVTVYLTVKDSMGGVATDSMVVQVKAMNHAPSFGLPVSSFQLQNYNRDSLLVKCVVSESTNDSLQYITDRRVDLIGAPQDTVLTAKATLDAQGTLHLPRRPNLRGWFTFRITLKDNGGTENGGVDSVSKDLKIFFSDTIIDGADQQVYRYVVLGHRAWFAENLRRTPRWGEINQDSTGVKYRWAQAMDLDSTECDNADCGSKLGFPHTGLCPTGWNIPDSLEWVLLVKWAAQGEGDSVGVNRLKSRTGWYWTYYAGSIYDGRGLDSWGMGLVPNYFSATTPDWGAARFWTHDPTNDDDGTLNRMFADFQTGRNQQTGGYTTSFLMWGLPAYRYTPILPLRCVKSIPYGQW